MRITPYLIRPYLIAPLFIATMMIPAAVTAQVVEAETATAEIVLAAPVVAEVSTDENTDLVLKTELEELRGGEAIVLGNQTLAAVSNGNTIGGAYTAGNVAISDSALSNFAGLGNIVINTGAQNNLQAGVNLVINLVP